MKKSIVFLLVVLIFGIHFAECSESESAIVLTTQAKEVILYIVVDSDNLIEWGDGTTSFIAESGKYSHEYEESSLHEIKIVQDNVLTFICNEQQVTTLDVTGATRLKDLECSDNLLTALDLTQNKNLQILDCRENSIVEIDVRNSPKAFLLNCSQDSLKILRVCELPEEGVYLDYGVDDGIGLDSGEMGEYMDRMILVEESTKIITEKVKNVQSILPTIPENEEKNPLRDIVDTKYEVAVNELIEKNIFSGYPDGTFLPEKTITRAEIVTVVTKFNNIEVLTDYELEFNDIAEHWGKGFISTLAAKGFVTGYGNGEFRPDNNVTYAEVGAMVLNSLGYKDEVLAMDIGWPNNYVEKSREFGLYKDITVTNPDDKMTRGEVAIFVYNVMNSDKINSL